jgi:2-oxoglutarate ferredoxin oxidoreductase subunit alpha
MMNKEKDTRAAQEITIKFAGDSGDGMQLTGSLFTDNAALFGNDLATFPDFPAEIRAPLGTLSGVSGFQLHFGSREIFTPGDRYDVLVAMNAAALKVNLGKLKKGGTLIVNTDGFDSKNLKIAQYDRPIPTEDDELKTSFELIPIQVTKLTRTALEEYPLSNKEKDRCKNMFVLGFLYWRFNRNSGTTIQSLEKKFATKPEILEANKTALQAGFNYGDTTETFTVTYDIPPAEMPDGLYRNIMGNEALVLGLIAASQRSQLPLFYGSYPITPASDILHLLSRHKNFGVKTFQAEDEIAGIGSAIGAAYGGHLAVTGTSGPGMALKGEALGLALMLELPLVIINVQRGGPSTGLPTKTEQADLLQAMYGRNGESPVAVLAASSPGDCFATAYEACRIAVEHMTPVILLSDGYIANGAEPWKIPDVQQLTPIEVYQPEPLEEDTTFQPYERNETLARAWATPGMKGFAHRVGGLEKEALTGNVSYDPANHEYMVKIRQAKVERIAQFLPKAKINTGADKGDILLVGWGSTLGVLDATTTELMEKGIAISHLHLKYLNPFPEGVLDILSRFQTIIVPEINNGQLSKIIQERFLVRVVPYNKIQGVPINKTELKNFIYALLESEKNGSTEG